MASEKQLEANRRNAQKSTGPRTSEGKARSSQNALKHGLCSRRTVLACESLAEFQQLHADLIRGFAPANAQEQMLVEHLAKCYWAVTRAQAIECSTFELGIDHVKHEKKHPNPSDPSEDFKALGYALLTEDEGHMMNYFRYARTADTAFHRALANLRAMQNDRFKREPNPAVQVAAPRTMGAASTPPNGFVASAVFAIALLLSLNCISLLSRPSPQSALQIQPPPAQARVQTQRSILHRSSLLSRAIPLTALPHLARIKGL